MAKENNEQNSGLFKVKPSGKLIYSQFRDRVLLVVALVASLGLLCYQWIPEILSRIVELNHPLLNESQTIANTEYEIGLQDLFWFLIIPAILSPLILGRYISSAWYLDDSGILYIIQTTDKREPLEFSKISSLKMGFIVNALGITAILNYLQYFMNSPLLIVLGKEWNPDMYYLSFISQYWLLQIIFGFILFSLPVFCGVIYGYLIALRYENQIRTYDKDIETAPFEGMDNIELKLTKVPENKKIITKVRIDKEK